MNEWIYGVLKFSWTNISASIQNEWTCKQHIRWKLISFSAFRQRYLVIVFFVQFISSGREIPFCRVDSCAFASNYSLNAISNIGGIHACCSWWGCFFISTLVSVRIIFIIFLIIFYAWYTLQSTWNQNPASASYFGHKPYIKRQLAWSAVSRGFNDYGVDSLMEKYIDHQIFGTGKWFTKFLSYLKMIEIFFYIANIEKHLEEHSV